MTRLETHHFDSLVSRGDASGVAARVADPTARFDEAMSVARGAADGGVSPSKQSMARKAADDFVSTAFLMPMMRMLRNDPFKSEMFHGGQAEEMFGSRLDQVFADRISQAMNLSIGETIYQQIMGSDGNRTTGASAKGLDTRG